VTRARTALLADSKPAFRAGLAAALGDVGIEIVAEAATAADAVLGALRVCPAICVLDADLPGGTIVAIKRIADCCPQTLVVVLGSADDSDNLLAAVYAGAMGYLPRSTTARGLARAVEAVLDGSAAIPRAGVGALIREVQANGRQQTSIDGLGVSLTVREATVIGLLRSGFGIRAIADELGLSPVTVRRHVGAVVGKAGSNGRHALVQSLQEN
jgi:DNA-binding NarL/FixJ family response regulator